jgi:hypothetical protein
MTDTCCCSCSDCCSTEQKKKIDIDFLYLDLESCTRCCGTETSLKEALEAVKTTLDAAGFDVSVNYHLIASEDEAQEFKFLSSPTIRVNGRDIDTDIKESKCESCGDICGEDIDCRVWVYKGKEYTVPPKELIVNSILEEIYSPKEDKPQDDYVMPENLKKFFKALMKK